MPKGLPQTSACAEHLAILEASKRAAKAPADTKHETSINVDLLCLQRLRSCPGLCVSHQQVYAGLDKQTLAQQPRRDVEEVNWVRSHQLEKLADSDPGYADAFGNESADIWAKKGAQLHPSISDAEAETYTQDLAALRTYLCSVACRLARWAKLPSQKNCLGQGQG